MTTTEEMPTLQEEVDDNCRRISQLEAQLLSLNAQVQAMKTVFMEYLELVKLAADDHMAMQDPNPKSTHS